MAFPRAVLGPCGGVALRMVATKGDVNRNIPLTKILINTQLCRAIFDHWG